MTARNWAMRVSLAPLAALLSACTTMPPIQTVRVVVPVTCQAVVPVRPVMPTEGQAPGVSLFDYVKASQPEIERREGYEQRLLAVLVGYIAPVGLVSQPS